MKVFAFNLKCGKIICTDKTLKGDAKAAEFAVDSHMR